jgi:hypothetical protein
MPTPLKPDQAALYARIREHLSALDSEYSFVDRLTRENHWSESFAREVLGEYAEFLFIAREGGHPISPPSAIDKAWHLHLLHTEAYWSDLCPNILQMQLQHSPHSRGSADDANFRSWAGLTLRSYAQFFGEPPSVWIEPTRGQAWRVVSHLALGCAFGLMVAAALGNLTHYGPVLATIGLLGGTIIFISTRRPSSGLGDGRKKNLCSSDVSTNANTSSDSADSSSHSGHGDSSGGSHGGHSCGGHGCGGGH